MARRSADIDGMLREAVGLHRQGRLREAERLYARVLKVMPDNFDALHLSGLAQAQAGRLGEAHRLMARALRINAEAADAWLNFANVLQALGRRAEALAALETALRLRPGDAEILRAKGEALLAGGRIKEAIEAFEATLARRPRDADALRGRGLARAALGDAGAALADFDAALAIAPDHPGTLYNRGTALLALERPAEALTSLERALASAPDNAQAWNNRGRALQALNRHAEAVESFTQAIARDRRYADAYSNRALSLLALGDYARGFADYEWRWKRSGMSDPRGNYRAPLWLGEYPPARKRILLTAEQGLGDTLQFARYAPLLARMGATVFMEVHPELTPLLEPLAGVAAVVARGEPLPDHDLFCPLGSLPLALKTDMATIPAEIPYLAAPAARCGRWRARLAAGAGKRVALAWAGNPRHPNDRNRSLELAALAPLFAVPGLCFVSIQRDLRAGDAACLAGQSGLIHLGAALDDMGDTAAVLALCDLVIAVDTSVAHLAGAMGRPLWVLLPFSCDWRWTAREERTPWYPQARLFRQRAPGDWQDVVARVAAALADFSRA
ncbi:MAG: tetratricopeptide repeat protein [Pseudolabrys sp.]|nr:tetratricopeptide repeat protein [Pseudolabrys sp.]